MELEHYLVNENVLEGIRANRTQPQDQADGRERGRDGEGRKSQQIDFFCLLLTLLLEIVRK